MSDQSGALTGASAVNTPAKAKNQLLEDVYVFDTTCVPPEPNHQGQLVGGIREHIMPIDGINTPFRFHYDRPLQMKYAVALKFLKNEAFVLCESDGTRKHYEATPRQPHELLEGERFVLQNNQVVARLDELTLQAIRTRVCQMDGGEKVVASGKVELIAWLVSQRQAEKKRDVVSELGPDDWLPGADAEDDMEDAA